MVTHSPHNVHETNERKQPKTTTLVLTHPPDVTVVTSEPVFFMSVHDIVCVGLFSLRELECLGSKQNTPKNR